jgi:hypothetical protein
MAFSLSLPSGAQLHWTAACMCPYTWAAWIAANFLAVSTLAYKVAASHSVPQQKFSLGHFFFRYLQLILAAKICMVVLCDMIYKWAKFQMRFQHYNINGFPCKNRCFRGAIFLWDNWQSDFLGFSVSVTWKSWRVSDWKWTQFHSTFSETLKPLVCWIEVNLYNFSEMHKHVYHNNYFI